MGKKLSKVYVNVRWNGAVPKKMMNGRTASVHLNRNAPPVMAPASLSLNKNQEKCRSDRKEYVGRKNSDLQTRMINKINFVGLYVMNKNIFLTIILVFMSLIFSLAFAMSHEAAARGKKLFENPDFAGGKRACSSCHPNGDGLSAAGSNKDFSIMSKSQKSLEEAINFCIVNANRGKAIAVDSQEMQDMVSYIKSLGSK